MPLAAHRGGNPVNGVRSLCATRHNANRSPAIFVSLYERSMIMTAYPTPDERIVRVASGVCAACDRAMIYAADLEVSPQTCGRLCCMVELGEDAGVAGTDYARCREPPDAA